MLWKQSIGAQGNENAGPCHLLSKVSMLSKAHWRIKSTSHPHNVTMNKDVLYYYFLLSRSLYTLSATAQKVLLLRDSLVFLMKNITSPSGEAKIQLQPNGI